MSWAPVPHRDPITNVIPEGRDATFSVPASTSNRWVYVTLPMRFCEPRVGRYRAQLFYANSTSLTQVSIPLAYNSAVGTPADVPIKIVSYDSTLTEYGLGASEGTPVLDFGTVVLNGEDITVVSTTTARTNVIPYVDVTCTVTLPYANSWYWIVFDFGTQALVTSTTDGWTGIGYGDKAMTSAYYPVTVDDEPTGTFNTSPILMGTANALWNLTDDPRDIPILINGVSAPSISVSLDGTNWSNPEALYSNSTTDWHSTMKYYLNLLDTNIGGNTSSAKTIYIRFLRDTTTGVTTTTEHRDEPVLTLTYQDGLPVIRAINVFYETAG